MKAMPASVWMLKNLIVCVGLVVAQEGVQPGSCSISCLQDVPCVPGDADFSDHPAPDGKPLSFLRETSRGSFHCDCPNNFTGLRCDRTYTTCGNSSSKLFCYNGGKCLEGIDVGLEQYQFCDCSDAEYQGKKYVGKYCEKRVSEIDVCDESRSLFCVNGGTCKRGETVDLESPCDCQSGFDGPHCQFKEGQVPHCDSECVHGFCQLGYADHSDIDDYLDYWLANVNSSSCVCKEGYTGATCEISNSMVESCGDDATIFCTNGGTCKSNFKETPQRPCECTTDFDGPHCEYSIGLVPECSLDCGSRGHCEIGLTKISDPTSHGDNNAYCSCDEGFHGVRCEVTAKDVDICNDEQSLFCVNGGECKNESHQSQGLPCDCPPDFAGPHCEFKKEDIPDCNLRCANNGTCVVGLRTIKDAEDVNRFWDTHVNFTHCACPEGWFGATCEIPSTPCGDRMCFNGGTCIDKNDQKVCDCANAGTQDSGVSVAGQYCQYGATSFCDLTFGSIFCVNGGVCEPGSGAGCTCSAGFTGPICEYEENKEEPCKLECLNGGKCRKGNKYVGNMTKDPELSFLQIASDENFEHCVCKDGFAGLKCETPVEVCGEDSHLCLHGSKCLPHDNGDYRCDCEEAWTETSRYAGKFCQHHHTDVCTPNGEVQYTGQAADEAFCVNDGVCKERVSGHGRHQGCDCSPLYSGPHCEFLQVFTNKVEESVENDKSLSTALIFFYGFVLCIFFTVATVVGFRIIQMSTEDEKPLHSTRPLDDIVDSVDMATKMEDAEGHFIDSEGNALEEVELL